MYQGVKNAQMEGFFQQPPNGLSRGHFLSQGGILIILLYLKNWLMKVNGFGHDSRPMGTPQNAPQKISVIAETEKWQQTKLINLAASKLIE